jgi:hypothetical protein
MKRKVRFLVDHVDLDLDVAVCENGQEEEVEVIDDGIMFQRWVEREKVEIWYQFPALEEGISYEFID